MRRAGESAPPCRASARPRRVFVMHHRFLLPPTALWLSIVIAAAAGGCGGGAGSGTTTTGAGGSTTMHTGGHGGAGGSGGAGGDTLITTTGTGGGTGGGVVTQGFDVEPERAADDHGHRRPDDADGDVHGDARRHADQRRLGRRPRRHRRPSRRPRRARRSSRRRARRAASSRCSPACNGTTLKRQVFVQLTGAAERRRREQAGGAAADRRQRRAALAGRRHRRRRRRGPRRRRVGPGRRSPRWRPPRTTARPQRSRSSTRTIKTVFPRGLLAPLLQWSWSLGDADAIRDSISRRRAAPSRGPARSPRRHPRADGRAVHPPCPSRRTSGRWRRTRAGGPTPSGAPDQLIVRASPSRRAAQAYGPITETWTVAPARLAGTVYYNSYGTQLVKNSTDYALQRHASTARRCSPSRRARPRPRSSRGRRARSAPGTGCRVCHVVASSGSTLIVQHGDTYARTSTYDLEERERGDVARRATTTPSAGRASRRTARSRSPTRPISPRSAPASQPLRVPADVADAARRDGHPDRISRPARRRSRPTASTSRSTSSAAPSARSTGNGTQLVALDFDAGDAHVLEPPRARHDDRAREAARRLPVVLPDERRGRLPLPDRQLEPPLQHLARGRGADLVVGPRDRHGRGRSTR